MKHEVRKQYFSSDEIGIFLLMKSVFFFWWNRYFSSDEIRIFLLMNSVFFFWWNWYFSSDEIGIFLLIKLVFFFWLNRYFSSDEINLLFSWSVTLFLYIIKNTPFLFLMYIVYYTAYSEIPYLFSLFVFQVISVNIFLMLYFVNSAKQ